MENNKSYISKLFLFQLVLMPILITILVLNSIDTLGMVISSVFHFTLSNNEMYLAYIITAFVSMIILGFIVGVTFSITTINKPRDERVRYLIPLIPLFIAIFAAALAYFLSKDNPNSFWWVIYTLKNPVFLFTDVILSFTGKYFIKPIIEISSYIGFILGVYTYELIGKRRIKSAEAKKYKLVFLGTIIVFFAIAYYGTGNIINNALIEIKYGEVRINPDLNELDLSQMAPFKNNDKLVTLQGNAALEFKDLKTIPRIDGATAFYPVYASFAKATFKGLSEYYSLYKFNFDNEDAFVSSNLYPLNLIKCSKTSEAYERLVNKETDIIFTLEPSIEHMKLIKEKGDDFKLTPIGYDAFVFFNNIENSVSNLLIKEIRDIYSGKIKRWSEVGGANKRILPFQRPENSGSQTIMLNKVMTNIDLMPAKKETSIQGMGEIINMVAEYKNAENAIGYSFMYYSSSMIKNSKVKYIKINGIYPTPETVKERTYPLTVPFYAVTLKSNKSTNVEKFIKWILSREGQEIIGKTGYIPLKE